MSSTDCEICNWTAPSLPMSGSTLSVMPISRCETVEVTWPVVAATEEPVMTGRDSPTKSVASLLWVVVMAGTERIFRSPLRGENPITGQSPRATAWCSACASHTAPTSSASMASSRMTQSARASSRRGNSGAARFTFDVPELTDGVSFVVIALHTAYLYFLLTGLLWVIPAMLVIKWMAGPFNKPDKD